MIERLYRLKNKLFLVIKSLSFRYNALDNSSIVRIGQRGAIGMGMGILYSFLGVVITVIVLANAIPILWPMMETASANITSMNTTTQGGNLFVSFWPIALLIIGIALAISVIVYALKQFGVMD